MNYRTLGRTGWQVSEISFGAWAIGGSWGAVDDAVTCAIPGAKRPAQVDANVAASDLASLSPAAMAAVQSVYDRLIRTHVHQRW